MKISSLVIVGVISTVALCSSAKSNLFLQANNNDLEFLKFIAKYSKQYTTKDEYVYRADLFRKNLDKINSHNLRNDATYTLKVNKFADWTKEEFKKTLGFKKPVA
jgi:cathepsin F